MCRVILCAGGSGWWWCGIGSAAGVSRAESAILATVEISVCRDRGCLFGTLRVSPGI